MRRHQIQDTDPLQTSQKNIRRCSELPLLHYSLLLCVRGGQGGVTSVTREYVDSRTQRSYHHICSRSWRIRNRVIRCSCVRADQSRDCPRAETTISGYIPDDITNQAACSGVYFSAGRLQSRPVLLFYSCTFDSRRVVLYTTTLPPHSDVVRRVTAPIL